MRFFFSQLYNFVITVICPLSGLNYKANLGKEDLHGNHLSPILMTFSHLGNRGVCVCLCVCVWVCACACVCVCMLVAQSCLILCNSMDFSLPDSSVYGILQARIREWVTFSFPRESSWPRRSNLCLLHCRHILYHLSHQGGPKYIHFSPKINWKYELHWLTTK